MSQDPHSSVTGVVFNRVTVGGNLIISGVTVQAPPVPPPLWVNVPPLPSHFLGRDALMDDLVQRLVAGQSPALSARRDAGCGQDGAGGGAGPSSGCAGTFHRRRALDWPYDDLGEKQRALEIFNQALSLRRQVGDRAGAATTLNNIGLVYDALRKKQQALDHYNQALPLLRRVGDRRRSSYP